MSRGSARGVSSCRICSLVYVYVFGGGAPHLHIHLAPHRPGDALNDRMIKGEVVVEKLWLSS